jgi:carboxyl-terminal processing protease
MKKVLLLLVFSISIIVYSNAQNLNKAATDAYVITRMAEKFHLQPRPLNDDFYKDVFNQLLKELDSQRIFFTTEDINKL